MRKEIQGWGGYAAPPLNFFSLQKVTRADLCRPRPFFPAGMGAPQYGVAQLSSSRYTASSIMRVPVTRGFGGSTASMR